MLQVIGGGVEYAHEAAQVVAADTDEGASEPDGTILFANLFVGLGETKELPHAAFVSGLSTSSAQSEKRMIAAVLRIFGRTKVDSVAEFYNGVSKHDSYDVAGYIPAGSSRRRQRAPLSSVLALV